MSEAIKKLFPCMLAGTVALLAITPQAWAAAMVESLEFENGTLVITSQGAAGKPKLESWESKSGSTPTRMVVLDLPNITGEKVLLDRLAASVRHHSVKRLIATSIGGDTLRVVIEVAHDGHEVIEPSVKQSGNETRLVLVPVSTEKPKPQVVEASKPVNNSAAQKEVTSLKAELEIANAQRMAFQKKNQALENELRELKNRPAPTLQAIEELPAVSPKALETLKAELKMATMQRDAMENRKNVLENELRELRNRPAPKADTRALEDELAALKSQAAEAAAQRAAAEEQNRALLMEISQLKNRPIPLPTQTGASSEEVVALKATLQKQTEDISKLALAKDELSLANQALVKKIKRLEDSSGNGNSHLQAALEENIRLQKMLDRKSGKNKDEASTDNSAELARLTNEVQRLEFQLQQYFNQNTALQNDVFSLREKLVEQDDLIKENVSGSPDVAANLKIALVRTVQKLNAAEAELARLKGGVEETPVAETKPEEEVVEEKSPDEPRGVFTPTRAQLEYTIRNQPDRYDAYLKLQGIYLKERDYARAEAVLQNLLMVNPRYPDAYYALSEVYLLQNNPVHAKASLETYKRLRPGDVNRTTALEKRINANIK